MSIPKNELQTHIEKTVMITKAFDGAKKRQIKAQVNFFTITQPEVAGQDKKRTMDDLGTKYKIPKLKLPSRLFYDIDLLAPEPVIKIRMMDEVAGRNQSKTPPPTPTGKPKKLIAFKGQAK